MTRNGVRPRHSRAASTSLQRATSHRGGTALSTRLESESSDEYTSTVSWTSRFRSSRAPVDECGRPKLGAVRDWSLRFVTWQAVGHSRHFFAFGFSSLFALAF